MTHPVGEERRKHERRARSFLVKFRVAGGPRPDVYPRVGRVCNLSRSGVLLSTLPELPVGTLLELRFPEKVFGGPPVTLHGAVRRHEGHENDADRPMGVMFVKAPALVPAR
jgi:hypothetical protein